MTFRTVHVTAINIVTVKRSIQAPLSPDFIHETHVFAYNLYR